MKKQISAATETNGKGNEIINYSGKSIYVGIDMHKNDWQIATKHEGITLGNHRMTGNSQNLIDHLYRRYPGGSFKCVYESCAWGFNLQQELTAAGMECIVIHAADLPTTNKERLNKTDQVDARRLAEHYENGSLKAIHVPTKKLQKQRSLVRLRKQTVKDLTRVRNRLKSALKFHGIDIPKRFANAHWSNNFMQWVKQESMADELLQDTLDFMLDQIGFQRDLLLKIERKIRKLMRSDAYITQSRLATSVPGIGPVTAAQFLLEIGDVRRFANFDKLNNYIGFYPGSHDSGDSQRNTGITMRRHNTLRAAFIEAAWAAIRTDPAMLEAYKELTKRMQGNKAIIRIARKLLRRLRRVLLTGIEYQKGVLS
jgi:transposase